VSLCVVTSRIPEPTVTPGPVKRTGPDSVAVDAPAGLKLTVPPSRAGSDRVPVLEKVVAVKLHPAFGSARSPASTAAEPDTVPAVTLTVPLAASPEPSVLTPAAFAKVTLPKPDVPTFANETVCAALPLKTVVCPAPGTNAVAFVACAKLPPTSRTPPVGTELPPPKVALPCTMIESTGFVPAMKPLVDVVSEPVTRVLPLGLSDPAVTVVAPSTVVRPLSTFALLTVSAGMLSPLSEPPLPDATMSPLPVMAVPASRPPTVRVKPPRLHATPGITVSWLSAWLAVSTGAKGVPVGTKALSPPAGTKAGDQLLAVA
jgi:hypothetical protein